MLSATDSALSVHDSDVVISMYSRHFPRGFACVRVVLFMSVFCSCVGSVFFVFDVLPACVFSVLRTLREGNDDVIYSCMRSRWWIQPVLGVRCI